MQCNRATSKRCIAAFCIISLQRFDEKPHYFHLTCQAWGHGVQCHSCVSTPVRGPSLQSTCVPFPQAELQCSSGEWHSLHLTAGFIIWLVLLLTSAITMDVSWHLLSETILVSVRTKATCTADVSAAVLWTPMTVLFVFKDIWHISMLLSFTGHPVYVPNLSTIMNTIWNGSLSYLCGSTTMRL